MSTSVRISSLYDWYCLLQIDELRIQPPTREGFSIRRRRSRRMRVGRWGAQFLERLSDLRGSAPTSVFQPDCTVSTHSVWSRRVMHGLPKKNASFCIPPESVTMKRQRFSSASISRIPPARWPGCGRARRSPWAVSILRVRGWMGKTPKWPVRPFRASTIAVRRSGSSVFSGRCRVSR